MQWSKRLAFPTAVLLDRMRRAQWLRTWVVMPWVIPAVAAVAMWQWLFNVSHGPLNFILLETHVVSQPVALLSNSGTALPALIIVNSWRWFPLLAVILLGGMQTVPVDVYEAAIMDGATGWQRFRYITLPLLNRLLFAVSLIGTLWSFNILTLSISRHGGVLPEPRGLFLSTSMSRLLALCGLATQRRPVSFRCLSPSP